MADNSKLCAILAWLFPIGLIWFFLDDKLRRDKYVAHHVTQSLVLFIFVVAVNIAGTIIPILGWFIILPVGGIMALILWIMGILSAIGGEAKPLPIIGRYGKNIKLGQ